MWICCLGSVLYGYVASCRGLFGSGWDLYGVIAFCAGRVQRGLIVNHVVWSRFHFGMLCTGGIWPCGVVLFEVLVGRFAVGCGYPTRGSSRVKRGRVMVLKTDAILCFG